MLRRLRELKQKREQAAAKKRAESMVTEEGGGNLTLPEKDFGESTFYYDAHSTLSNTGTEAGDSTIGASHCNKTEDLTFTNDTTMVEDR